MHRAPIAQPISSERCVPRDSRSPERKRLFKA